MALNSRNGERGGVTLQSMTWYRRCTCQQSDSPVISIIIVIIIIDSPKTKFKLNALWISQPTYSESLLNKEGNYGFWGTTECAVTCSVYYSSWPGTGVLTNIFLHKTERQLTFYWWSSSAHGMDYQHCSGSWNRLRRWSWYGCVVKILNSGSRSCEFEPWFKQHTHTPIPSFLILVPGWWAKCLVLWVRCQVRPYVLQACLHSPQWGTADWN